MRRPKSALGAAFVALGLSAQFAPAQQMSRESGSDQNPAKSSSAIDPALANRSARYLLRNGVDYLNYQEYTRALRFLRAAESREKELNADEVRSLKQAILQAQRGMREPAPSDRLARSRRPGALAVASPIPGQAATRENDGIQLAAATRIDDRLPPLPDSGPAFDQDREPAAVRTATPAPSPTAAPGGVGLPDLPEATPLPGPRSAPSSTPSQPAGIELPPIRDLPPVTAEPIPDIPPGPSGQPIRVRAEAMTPASSTSSAPIPLPDLPPTAGIPSIPAGMPPGSTAPPVPTELPPVTPAQTPAPASTPSQNPAPPPIGLEPLPEPTKPVEAPSPTPLPATAAKPAEPAALPAMPDQPASLPPTPTPLPEPATTPAPAAKPAEPVALPSTPDQPASLPPTPTPLPEPAPTQAPASRPAEPAVLPALPDQPTPAPPATTPLPEPGPAPIPTTAGAAPAPPAELPAMPTNEPVPTPTPAASVTPPPADEPRPAPGQPAIAAGPALAAEELPNRPAPAAGPGPADAPSARTEATIPPTRPFSPEVEGEIARIAERQERDARTRPPVPPELSGPIRPGAPPATGMQGPANPGDTGSVSASSRFIIERAPSPTEAWPIRRIPVPEEVVPLAARNFAPTRKYWQAPAICHMPLYFQDAALERYGHSVENFFGPAGRFLTYPIDDPKQSKQRFQIFQPLFSAGLMAFQVGTLPYKMIVDPPWEAEYDLGYYRPGDRVPTDIFYATPFGVGPPLHGNNY